MSICAVIAFMILGYYQLATGNELEDDIASTISHAVLCPLANYFRGDNLPHEFPGCTKIPTRVVIEPDRHDHVASFQVQDKENINYIQKMLTEWGYDIDDANGIIDIQTRAAIRAYQSDWEMAITGEITQQLQAMLERNDKRTRPQWFKVQLTNKTYPDWLSQDCKVWNPYPQAREKVTWSGSCYDGKLNGSGKLIWLFTINGKQVSQTHTGNWQNGEQHGKGVFKHADGGRYEGELKDGKAHGKGVFKYADGGRYEGDWRNGKRHGKGVFKYADGGRYEGDWRNGKKHGKGVFKYADGDRYEGEWEDDKKHGKGVFKHADGGRYEGELKDGKAHGKGVFKYADGGRYEGEIKDAKAHGKGVLKYPNGALYEGDWRNGKKHGKGVFRYSSGALYDGDWNNGKRHGKGVLKYADGDRYEGEWEDDKKHGKGVFKYASGALYEGAWEDDKPSQEGVYTTARGRRVDMWYGCSQYSSLFDKMFLGDIAFGRSRESCGFK